MSPNLICGLTVGLWFLGVMCIGLFGSLVASDYVYRYFSEDLFDWSGIAEMYGFLFVAAIATAWLMLLPLWWGWPLC